MQYCGFEQRYKVVSGFFTWNRKFDHNSLLWSQFWLHHTWAVKIIAFIGAKEAEVRVDYRLFDYAQRWSGRTEFGWCAAALTVRLINSCFNDAAVTVVYFNL